MLTIAAATPPTELPPLTDDDLDAFAAQMEARRPFNWQRFASKALPHLPADRRGNVKLRRETLERLGYVEDEPGDFALLADYYAEILSEEGFFAVARGGAIVVHLHHRCGYAVENLRPADEPDGGAGSCTWREYGRAVADRDVFGAWNGGSLQAAVLNLLDAALSGESVLDHPEAQAGRVDRLMELATQPKPRSVRQAVTIIRAAVQAKYLPQQAVA